MRRRPLLTLSHLLLLDAAAAVPKVRRHACQTHSKHIICEGHVVVINCLDCSGGLMEARVIVGDVGAIAGWWLCDECDVGADHRHGRIHMVRNGCCA